MANVKRKINISRKIQQIINKQTINYGWYNNIIMEYQKIANLLVNTSNQPAKFRTKNWIEINDDIGRRYFPNKQIRFKTPMLRSSLLDYSDAYILVKGKYQLIIMLVLVLL